MNITRTILVLMIGLTIGFGVGNRYNRTSGVITWEDNPKKEKFNRLVDYLDNEYVTEVNTDSIVEVAINDILSKLDPHSTYISSRDAISIGERMQGDFIGIGVNYYVKNDTIAVISTIPKGPSARAGILSGDRILMANNDTLYGKFSKDEDLIDKLKGKAGSKVKLLVHRPQTGNLSIDVKRGKVPLESVEAAFMLTQEMGYIKIERFAETTYVEFKKALKHLQRKHKLKSLVLDLRQNGGGYVRPALKIADEFLEDDKMIMFTKNRVGKIQESIATDDGEFEEGQVYVLIDENSASASEILAGALQDNDKGTIIGRRSYGKGLVQREMDLGDGSMVRLTVSQYFTPTGRSIQRSYKDGKDAYNKEYLERYDSGELQDSSKIKIADSLVFTTPKGKVVYGGGGIIPDMYVEKSKDRNVEVLEFAEYSGVLSRFVFNELDTNRNYYNKLSKQDLQNLDITDIFIKAFKVYSEEKGLEFSGASANGLIATHLRAEMAKQLFNTNFSYKILSESDSMIKRVFELEGAGVNWQAVSD